MWAKGQSGSSNGQWGRTDGRTGRANNTLSATSRLRPGSPATSHHTPKQQQCDAWEPFLTLDNRKSPLLAVDIGLHLVKSDVGPEY